MDKVKAVARIDGDHLVFKIPIEQVKELGLTIFWSQFACVNDEVEIHGVGLRPATEGIPSALDLLHDPSNCVTFTEPATGYRFTWR